MDTKPQTGDTVYVLRNYQNEIQAATNRQMNIEEAKITSIQNGYAKVSLDGQTLHFSISSIYNLELQKEEYCLLPYDDFTVKAFLSLQELKEWRTKTQSAQKNHFNQYQYAFARR